ncbi:MAG TPA: hypothetical protein PKD78_07455, partial [Saprospiraceae bacterium]|nr:hypothetical protein [Saprospiraceae bacterium]
GADDCFFGLSYDIQCDKIEVRLKGGNATWPIHQWDFGDGSPILSGGADLKTVFHTYTDVNPYLKPITARHRLDDVSP